MLRHYRESFRAAPLSTAAGLLCFLPIGALVTWAIAAVVLVELAAIWPDLAGLGLVTMVVEFTWWGFSLLPGSLLAKLAGAAGLALLGVKILLGVDRLTSRAEVALVGPGPIAPRTTLVRRPSSRRKLLPRPD
jgi:hypothetical protein